MSRKKQSDERKCRQRVMRQLRFDESEDEENDECSRDQIVVDRVSVTRQSSRQPWQLDRPWEKTDEDRDKVKRQREQIDA